MYRYKNLLVAINLTDMDTAIIHYAKDISWMAKSKNIYYLHINRNLRLPEIIIRKYPELLLPLDEIALRKMKEAVNNTNACYAKTKASFNVVEGSPLEEILRQITRKDIDLVIVGRKKDVKDTRLLPMKIVRKAPCTVMVIPDNTIPSITKILVPVDFSDYSANAMNVAVAFASSKGIADIQCLHVYQLPIGYSKTGKSPEEFAEIMKNNAQMDYQKFVQGINLKGVSVKPEFVLGKKPSKSINEVVERDQIDLIVTGARGKDAAAAILLGSVTEDLILGTRVPLVAVKKKGTGMNFLEALLNI